MEMMTDLGAAYAMPSTTIQGATSDKKKSDVVVLQDVDVATKQQAKEPFVGIAQQASASHSGAFVQPSPYVSAASLAPPPASPDPGYIERLGSKRKDMMRHLSMAFVVAAGVSIHWAATQIFSDWLETADITPLQRVLAIAFYPCLVLFCLWNIRAFH